MSGRVLFHSAREKYYGALLRGGVLCVAARRRTKAGLASRVPSNADGDSAESVAIAQAIFDQVQTETRPSDRLPDQIWTSEFDQITRAFVEETFSLLKLFKPGRWDFDPEKSSILGFEQYCHLAGIASVASEQPEFEVLLRSDYVIAPDILVVREPEWDETIDEKQLLGRNSVAPRPDVRRRRNNLPLLRSSISFKWTLRNKTQNARSEALNLVPNWLGRVPFIAVVTGEPLPSRLASLALGTGDLDCVYHFALPELIKAVEQQEGEDSARLVQIMVDGKRLKDISDLPLDLAV